MAEPKQTNKERLREITESIEQGESKNCLKKREIYAVSAL